MPDRVLVTGVAGFIGSWVAEHLLARGDRVIGVDNFDPFYDRRDKERNLLAARQHAAFRLVEADCCEVDSLETLLSDEPIDVIVHLAAKAGVRPSLREPLAYTRANVVGTQSMLELARRRGIGRFVLGSSSSVYGNTPHVPFAEHDPPRPISPYAATKVAAEALSRTYSHLYDLSTVILRFFTVYGPRQRPDLAIRKFADLLLRGDPIPMYGNGSSQRDYTWIEDIVGGVLSAIDYTATHARCCETVNLGGHRTTSLTRLIDLVGQSVGVEPEVIPHPDQPGDVRRTFADVSKARLLLGYQPTVTVEAGIPRFGEWMRTRARRTTRPRALVADA